jgi:hypothetical protein
MDGQREYLPAVRARGFEFPKVKNVLLSLRRRALRNHAYLVRFLQRAAELARWHPPWQPLPAPPRSHHPRPRPRLRLADLATRPRT